MKEMKNSGIEWIGKIPIEWTICRFKTIANIYNGNSIKDEDKEKYEDADDAIPYIATKDVDVTFQTIAYDNGMYVKKDDTGFKRAPKNSTLLCIEGGSAGKKIAFTNQEVCFINKLCCFYSESICNKFLFYYMLSPAFAVEFNNHLSGLIGGVSISEIKDFSIVLPKNEEQQKIASFLDRKCAEIDAVIEKTKATIEEYKKLKQSLITEAVTKGIRGDRPMKDSGIEWIGEIPAEWDVSFLKRYCEFKTGVTPSTANPEWFDGNWNWFTPGDFNEDYYLTDSNRKLSFKAKEDGVAVVIPANTVVIIGIGGTAGKIGVTTNECSCNQQITALLTDTVHYKYLMYWMIANTKILKETALYTTLPILNNETIGEYLFIVPTEMCEQEEIADHLDKKCSEIDTLIAKKTALLDEMEIYKKSVIYEYVTGKKEVK